MRPIYLRFACFGPYVQEQCIDFEALEKSGLFLISGETGAGKTTILDAICYALYGRSSGGLRGDISVMRCKTAQKDQETFVEFTFESGSSRYRFTRSLKYGRKNLNDSHNCLVWKDDVYVPIFENPKATVVNREAERIIGLTYEQFRQVIVLPQGQFERLLVSDSAEKEKILVSLFHADRWQRITEELTNRVLERDNQLKQERQQIIGKLGEYRCTSLEELGIATQNQQVLVESLSTQTAEAEAALKRAREAGERAMLENKDFEALEVRKNLLTKLQSRQAAMQAEEILLQKADRAETITPQYQQFRQTEQTRTQAASQVQESQKALTAANQALEHLTQIRKRLDENREKMHRMQEETVLLTNAEPLYASLPEKQKRDHAASKAMQQSIQMEALLNRRLEHAERNWLQAQQNQRQAIEDYSRVQSLYLRNIGSTLARELVEGQPCPVCGSRTHPSPAPLTTETMTADQVEQKNEALKLASQQVTDTAHQRQEAQKQHTEAVEALNRSRQEAAFAKQELETALSQRFAQVENLEQLHRQITLRKSQLERFQTLESGWQQDWNQANANILAKEHNMKEKTAAMEAAAQAMDSAYQAWEKALQASGLETETTYRGAVLSAQERQRRWTALIQYRTDLAQAESYCQELAEALKNRQAPDLEACRRQVAQWERNFRDRSEALILGKNRLRAMHQDLELLKTRQLSYTAARREVDADLEFANRLRGRSGLSLQRYVLGVVLTAITVEANRLLRGIYGGRYQLFRTDAISGSGHKGGLELEVLDSQNSQRRSVTTLSGGEKFLVALSLAIGLSTVVQAQGQGIRLEAMFIDEGFGSLDREAVLDALEVLRGIQRSSGTVGIISHVETLAEIIPTRLEVKKGPQGSNLVVK